MKGTSVFLDHIAGRPAAARMVDGKLEDFLVDPPEGGPNPIGTIFRAVVDRPIKGQGGVFVRLPDGETGFLRHAKGLATGQAVLVQTTGFAEPGKAGPMTQKLLFKSKYAIVTPDAPGHNISRQIKDDERRAALKFLAEDVMEGSAYGLILRSETESAEDEEIAEDIAEMRALAEEILANTQGDPELLLDGADAHAVAWREWGNPDEIETSPGCFESRGILDALAASIGPQVPLPGGGSILIEPTRALIAVDVNSGTDFSPAAALKANIEAARALPRFLRLRGLGGQITIDFAPLSKKDRRQMEQVLRTAFRNDPIETALAGWTPLGNFEAQRKRERLPLDAAILKALQ
ncbi:ribonuclease E/G [Aliiruegeria lutimaris]|uniref:Ribonuclease, Rne/Rng family n=1 Tax=Aliiruegeria lutimaris TaxID=571298 RepID=A0A1G9LNB1_9RHOB|nr:ribonuclease E/G [Aliiruegeria lutimaris]SDL63410.1 ribonuclease, Rne/Rng family [Aliiruegeria lutimaris]